MNFPLYELSTDNLEMAAGIVSRQDAKIAVINIKYDKNHCVHRATARKKIENHCAHCEIRLSCDNEQKRVKLFSNSEEYR